MRFRRTEAQKLLAEGQRLSVVAGERGTAASRFSEAIEAARADGDRAAECAGLMGLGILSEAADNPDGALNLYAQACGIARELGNTSDEAQILLITANLYRQLGREPEARSAYEAAMPLLQAAGHKELLAEAEAGVRALDPKLNV